MLVLASSHNVLVLRTQVWQIKESCYGSATTELVRMRMRMRMRIAAAAPPTRDARWS